MTSIVFFVSDEGYGHAMRQKNVIRSLVTTVPNLDIHVYTKRACSIFREAFGQLINVIPFYNQIETVKTSKGALDKGRTQINFNHWYDSIDSWIAKAAELIPSDTIAIVSDSVPQASLLGVKLSIPVIFIQHFTWDWLYQELYPVDHIYRELNRQYTLASSIIFPPLTPINNLKLHPNHESIDFIVNQELFLSKRHKVNDHTLGKCKNILLMNNGTYSMTEIISKIIKNSEPQENIKYFARSSNLTEAAAEIILERDDIELIETMHDTHLLIAHSDIVVSRAGYNSISELLLLGKQSLLVAEEGNPEISSNLALVKELHCDLCPCTLNNCLDRLNYIIKQEPEYSSPVHYSCHGSNQVAKTLSDLIS